MNKKILTIFITGLFLMTGLILSPASGIKISNEKESEPIEKSMGLLDIFVYDPNAGPGHMVIPLQGVIVTIIKKDNPSYTRIGITGPLGHESFYGPPAGIYYLKLRKHEHGLDTEINFDGHGFFSYSAEDFTYKSRNKIESNSLISYIFDRCPLLQQLFQRLPEYI